jgi:Putative MetA-pathway of phenol degradation
MHDRLVLIITLSLFAATARAQSNDDVINPDRPGIADGSATISRGAFQIEIGGERDDQNSQHTFSTPTLLRYGLANSFELRVETNGYQTGGDIAPISIGFKKHFHDTPSLGVIGRYFFAKNGQRATGDVRLAADMDLNGKWSVNPNVGVAFGDSTTGTAALTVQYNFSKKLNAFVDGGYQSPSALLLDTGMAWVIGNRTQLDFSVGWGAHGSTTPNVFWSAGISRMF